MSSFQREARRQVEKGWRRRRKSVSFHSSSPNRYDEKLTLGGTVDINAVLASFGALWRHVPGRVCGKLETVYRLRPRMSVGSSIPHVDSLFVGAQAFESPALFDNQRVLLITLPGAFTPV